MSIFLRHAGAILGALAIWWVVTVLCGLGLYALFPPDLSAPDPGGGRTYSFMAGVSLGRHWQNFPGNILGFVAALYTFQGLLRRSTAVTKAEQVAAAHRPRVAGSGS